MALGFAIFALDRSWGDFPPVAELLSPFTGLWQRARSPFDPGTKAHRYELAGLHGRVEVQIDSDQIKHVFAENDDDLYFAQGWISAADRLWEMEFLTRLAAGRLAEIVGAKALPYDRLFRKLGIPDAAKETAALMLQDSDTGPALRAYAAGVNAYIQTLDPKRLPFEYRLLGQKPETWTTEKAALLLKLMTFNLSGHSIDLQLTRSRSVLTREEFDELFPLDLRAQMPDPVIPKGTNWSFGASPPHSPKSEFVADLKVLDRLPQPNPANGSNNWVVSGKKSTTGLPILSNDIHLDYGLPSLWYEMQLVSPRQNVYGIALPGAPGIILGFNQKIAWGVTNGGSDVLDWYQLRYRDDRRNEYLYDGNWRPVVSREVEIRIKNAKPETLLLRSTHFGPVVYEDSEVPAKPWIPKGLAMRWAGLDPGNELKSFLLLNRAKTADECRAALENYQNPSQNFVCADSGGKIGLWHMGRFPVRWAGQGRLISDGSSTEYDWKGWVPRTDVPSVKNPERGFLSSANQFPTDERYPYYLGWPYAPPWRGTRINDVLRQKKKFSPEDLVRMQTDTYAVPAREALPALLGATLPQVLDEPEKEALAELQKWDFHFSADSVAATIFHAWFQTVQKRLWSQRFPDPADYFYPRDWTTLRLIREQPDSKWFDDPATPKRETLRTVAAASLKEALSEITERMGTSNIKKWQWGRYHPTRFGHIAKIPGLGAPPMAMDGVDYSILANQGHHGPVWKMVVALGPKPRAWAVYPGGQSGDPTSPYFDNFLEPWRRGQMKEVVFLAKATEQSPRLEKSIRLEPRQSPEVSR